MKKILLTICILCISPLPSAFAAQTASFNEVWKIIQIPPAVTTQAEAEEMAVYQSGKLPQYEMNMSSIFQKKGQIEADAIRTTTDKSDYYPRLEKLLHPNGICVAGKWKITQPTHYTGGFAHGAEMLFIGRVSVAMQDTTFQGRRGFGLAGKLFPTMSKTEKVQTQNFFSVDVLLGRKQQSLLSSAMTNSPESGLNFATIGFAGLAVKLDKALKAADINPLFRPVKNIASLGGVPHHEIREPQFAQYTFSRGTMTNQQPDFRNELSQALSDNKVLSIDISVADGNSIKEAQWKTIGTIQIEKALVSYGCDRRLHFAHPKIDEKF